MSNLNKLAKIVYEEVGYLKTPKDENNPKMGLTQVPKKYATFRDFVLDVYGSYKNGNQKTYRGLEIEWIIGYAKKYKKKEIRTILHQLNINGKTDTITVIGKKQPQISFAKNT